MKNLKKLFGIIALAAIIGLTFAACSNGTTSGGGSSSFGPTLNLVGQVVRQVEDEETGAITYSNYNGTDIITWDFGGNGAITIGQLLFTVETPTGLAPIDPGDELFSEMYTNVQISDPSVQYVILESLDANDSDLYRQKLELKASETSLSMTLEQVVYVYATGDVTISGTGGDYNIDNEDIFPFPVTLTVKNFNLELKEGWNAVYSKGAVSAKIQGLSVNTSGTMSMSTANPSSLKWVLDDSSSPAEGGQSRNMIKPLSLR